MSDPSTSVQSIDRVVQLIVHLLQRLVRDVWVHFFERVAVDELDQNTAVVNCASLAAVVKDGTDAVEDAEEFGNASGEVWDLGHDLVGLQFLHEGGFAGELEGLFRRLVKIGIFLS